jgi:mRNA-degrading endonuclease toxin of MazEF toxin-antitoxin module
LVLRYSYLWRAEQQQGREEGAKDRPCAVVLVTATDTGGTVVTVLPITHTPPSAPETAVEIPQATKSRLGLDAARSWVVLTEANRFLWPGPDLRPRLAHDAGSVAYGLLPYGLMEDIRRKFLALVKARRAGLTPRTA